MKYYKSSKFPKFIGGAGFYSIIACCLIAIGAVSFFAFSKTKNKAKENEKNSSDNGSYSSKFESYNSTGETNNVSNNESTEIVDNEVSDVPYNEATEEKTERSFVLPVEGNVSKGYSDTALQYSATYNDMRLHTGIDILCDSGAQIVSVGNGKVVSISESEELGKVIEIEHGDGITAKYCGLADIYVGTDEQVSAGTLIGTCGQVPSESNEKSHIHFEVLKDGVTVSPLTALNLD